MIANHRNIICPCAIIILPLKQLLPRRIYKDGKTDASLPRTDSETGRDRERLRPFLPKRKTYNLNVRKYSRIPIYCGIPLFKGISEQAARLRPRVTTPPNSSEAKRFLFFLICGFGFFPFFPFTLYTAPSSPALASPWPCQCSDGRADGSPRAHDSRKLFPRAGTSPAARADGRPLPRGPAPPHHQRQPPQGRRRRPRPTRSRLPIGAPRWPGRTHARTPPPGPPASPVAAAVTGFVRVVPGGARAGWGGGGDVGPRAAAGGGREREAAPQGGAEPEGELRRPAAGREGEGRGAANGGA